MNRLPNTLPPFLWGFVKKQWWAFSIMAFAMLIWALNEAVFPYFIKLMVDAVHELQPEDPGALSALAPALIGMGVTWGAMEIAMRVLGYVGTVTYPRFRASIRETIFDYVRQHSHEYFGENFAGSIANKISDLPRSSERIMEIVIEIMIGISATFLIGLFLLANISLMFAAIMIIWLAAHLGVTFFYLKRINHTAQVHSEAVSTLSGQVADKLSNILTIRLFARGKYESEHLKRYQDDEISKYRKSGFLIEKVNLIRGFVALLFMVGMITTLVVGWSQRWVTLGDFSLISMLSFNLMGQIWYMTFQMTQLFQEVGTAKAALTLITQEHNVKDVSDAVPLEVRKGEIRFDNVTFQYKRNANIFKDKNVLIKAGQKVGLVGFSGSGKSTFANLILRFYDISSGRILIDGQDISKVTQDSLRAQIAMIPQDPTLFHRTLLENIRYGRLDATDDEVIEASKKTHCHEFITHLSEGYQTIAGERGAKLSGGQRQRIAIARAILKNAPILILDEATSALDSVTEKLIQESLQVLMENRTTIVIAHRLATLKDMDRILVFDKGEIVEDGTSQELLEKKGHYARLWQMQVGGFLPDSAENSV